MRSALTPLLGRPRNLALRPGEAPFAYVQRATGNSLFSRILGGSGAEEQLRAYESIPTLYACVSELAEATAQVEWCLYRKGEEGYEEEREPVMEHASIDLWEQPNPFMDQAFFVEFVQMHLDLTGEAFIVIGTDPRAGTLPLSLWPVVPTMMEPVTDPKAFLTGFVYTDPDGVKVPFTPDEVIHFRYPHPLNPYIGLSVVKALLPDLDADRFATEYNRNFFLNSAEPGGIIELPEAISDDEFTQLRERWDEQHRGTGNAHRVALLTNGMKWVDRSFSMRDLQFSELRSASDARIMLGFKMGKTLLGQTEGVNRATAEAAEYVFGKYRVVRRLNRFRRMLNRRLLPMFAGGETLVWDYESPVTANVEVEVADRDSRVGAVTALVAAGFDPAETLAAFDFPEIKLAPKAAAPAPPALAPAEEEELEEVEEAEEEEQGALALRILRRPALASGHQHHQHFRPVRPRRAEDPPAQLPPEDLPDVGPLQEFFEATMAPLLADVAAAENDQKDDLVNQVEDLAANGSLADLADLSVDTEVVTAAIAAAMAAVGDHAADRVVKEAEEQGVTVKPREANPQQVDDVASVVASLLAGRLVASAAAAAMRANSDKATPKDIATFVQDQLEALSPDTPRATLAGALTGTQNEARIQTLRRAPEGALYAVEKNDSNTCQPCRDVDGKWLGNISEIDQVTELYPGGAYGGYIRCEGRERCRGTITGVWRRSFD